MTPLNQQIQEDADAMSGIDKDILLMAQPATSIVDFAADDRSKS